MARPPLPDQGDAAPWGDDLNAHIEALGAEVDALTAAGGGGGNVPAGGTADQVLTKKSSTNYDSEWRTPTGGGSGNLPAVGNEGDLLTVVSGAWAPSPPIASGVELVPPDQLDEADSLVVWVQGVAYRTTLADLSEYFGATGGGPGGGGDSGGVQFAPGTLNLTQGGATGAVQFGLSQAPTADVTITLTSPAASLVSPAPTSLTFTPANYATPQQVVFTVPSTYLTGSYSMDVTWATTSTDFAYVGLNGKIKVNVTGIKVAAPLYFPHPGAIMADDFSTGTLGELDGRVPSPIGSLGPWNAPVVGNYTVANGRLELPVACGAAAVVPIGTRTSKYVMHLVLDPYSVPPSGAGRPSFWPGMTYPGATGNKGIWHEVAQSYNVSSRDPNFITNGSPGGGSGAVITGDSSFTGPTAGTLYDFYFQIEPTSKIIYYMGNPRPGTPSGAMKIDMSASSSTDITGNSFGWGGYNAGDEHGIKQIQCIPDLDLKALFGV